VAATIGPNFGSKLQRSITLASLSSACLRLFMRNWFIYALPFFTCFN